jgi:hypothetical protein
MLAFAAHKRARIAPPYDTRRNRCGLPEPLLTAAGQLSTHPVVFDATPCLSGLTPETTAGLLLLFQRISLLEIAEASALPVVDPSAVDTIPPPRLAAP